MSIALTPVSEADVDSDTLRSQQAGRSVHYVINIGRIVHCPNRKKDDGHSIKLPKVGYESTLHISPACFMRGVIQSEEDANWTSLLEIGDKTSRDNTPPLVGLYSYVYLYIARTSSSVSAHG